MTVGAAAVAVQVEVPRHVILPDCDETSLDCGILLEDTDFSWLQE